MCFEKAYYFIHISNPAQHCVSERFYLPQRIYIRDLIGDGKHEVVVASNKGSLGRLFGRFRDFSSGRTMVLSWNGSGLAPMWQTAKTSGYVSDCAIADFDNDGKDEVVVAAVESKGTMVTAAKSSIMAYELAQVRSASE